MLPVPVIDPEVRRATPKSMIFTVPSWLMKTLAGLMSRWTMPCWWACARPARTCTMIPTLRSRDIGEVVPLEQLHGDVRRSVGVLPEVEDVHHVRVVHLGDRLGLPDEALVQLDVV